MPPRLDAIRAALPVHLKARVRSLTLLGTPVPVAGGAVRKNAHVLYWMRAGLATRTHENPALGAAVAAANALQLPLRVLLHVEDDYAHGTARRQQFLIEGAREVSAEFLTGCAGALIVEPAVDRRADEKSASNPRVNDELSKIGRDGWSRLLSLASDAAVIVAEEPFCAPFVGGLMKLQRTIPPSASNDTELWAVDCASVVPSSEVASKNCHRCFAYEKATSTAHKAAAREQWPVIKLDNGHHLSREDGSREALTASTALAAASGGLIDRLVAASRVDHTVKPVAGNPGGSKSGYARWDAWVRDQNGLKTYAKRRNDALDPSGVSRMSGYINAGFVSPMRLNREATAAGGAGVGKWLNEFRAWRGMSVGYCYWGWSLRACPSAGGPKHMAAPEKKLADPGLWLLPEWAQRTLRGHARDPRTRVFTRDELARAQTNAHAWNGMQRYLVETGELHNNARMGWGGAVPGWTPSPEEAMAALVDLNHTFAYDGHAPPSYGGLFGSLGLFAGQNSDQRVYGKVKQAHAKGRYAAMGKPDAIARVLALSGTIATVPCEKRRKRSKSRAR